MRGYSFIPQLHLSCVYRSFSQRKKGWSHMLRRISAFYRRHFLSQMIHEPNAFFAYLNYKLWNVIQITVEICNLDGEMWFSCVWVMHLFWFSYSTILTFWWALQSCLGKCVCFNLHCLWFIFCLFGETSPTIMIFFLKLTHWL